MRAHAGVCPMTVNSRSFAQSLDMAYQIQYLLPPHTQLEVVCLYVAILIQKQS